MMMSSAALLITGVVLVAVGVLVAGNMIIVGVGIVAMVAAGLLEVLAIRQGRCRIDAREGRPKGFL